MQTTEEALKAFTEDKDKTYWSFIFGDNQEYELCFEKCIWDNQMYVALYKNKHLLVNKVVVKPGYIKQNLTSH